MRSAPVWYATKWYFFPPVHECLNSESFKKIAGAPASGGPIFQNARKSLLVGLGFLDFTIRAFVRGADEATLDEHVRTFLIVVATYSASRGRNT
jgi:hypothetical protein